MKRNLVLPVFFFIFLGYLPAQDLGVRHFQVPISDGGFQSRDFLQALLEIGGSEVVLPENFPSQQFDAGGPGSRISLFAWNALLKDFGVQLSLQPEALAIRMDLHTFEATLDRFEQTFIDGFHVERAADLLRISSPSSQGPVVVLVHGLDSSKRLFGGTCKVLVEKGYDVYFFEYPNDDRVIRNAERLSEALKTLPPERQQDITLVTISMGGVISQLMLETPELQVRGVRRFIACVPPFHGSEMAAFRGIVEIGDHTLSIFFNPQKALDFWGDGMGRAGIDLQPRSLLMAQLDRLKRDPNVHYSILAGNKGIFEPTVLQKAREELAASPSENSIMETVRLLTLDRLDLILQFQSPNGDGVVTLESATLEGVTDRVVLPFSHLDFLTGFTAKEDIPALKEVMKRLPVID
ncbi:hypothetical protein P0Y35_02370 [Kiritimatiellaeota bacterium B1221]|nr:hypothetical protein [Kiritimatiellaeota bacterium B1221]